MNNKFLSTAILLFASGLLSTTLIARPVESIFPNWYVADIDGTPMKMAYISNHPIDKTNSNIDRVIVLIHGAKRNQLSYDRMLSAIKQNNKSDSTLLIMPQFLQEEDISAFQLPNDVLFWSGGWRQGHLSSSGTSQNPRPSSRISSFEIVNRIVEQLVERNTGIQHVVIAGHSAGGQYSQRFAAGSQLEQRLTTKNVAMRYVPSNPSSFVYFSAERRVPGFIERFAVPSEEERLSCAKYNEYKYGLADLNRFMKDVGVPQIVAQYPLRDVRYLQGADDNDPDAKLLSNSCRAKLQGSQRLERGIIFYHHIRKFFGPDVHQRHVQAVVPDFGHTSRIFTSPCGLSFLLDIGECHLTTPVNLIASLNNATVELTWSDRPDGKMGYEIERSSDGGANYQQIASLNQSQTRYVDNRTNASSIYTYRVRAFSGTEKTYYSNAVVVETPSTDVVWDQTGGGGGATGFVFVSLILSVFIARSLFVRRNYAR